MGSGKYNASLEEIQDPRRLLHLIQDMQAHGRNLSDANAKLIRDLADLKKATTPLVGAKPPTEQEVKAKQIESTLNAQGVTGHIPMQVEGAVGFLAYPQDAKMPWRGQNGYQEQIAEPMDGQLSIPFDDNLNHTGVHAVPLPVTFWNDYDRAWHVISATGVAVSMTQAQLATMLTAQSVPYQSGTIVWVYDLYAFGMLYIDPYTPGWYFIYISLLSSAQSGLAALAAAESLYSWMPNIDVYDYAHQLQFSGGAYAWGTHDQGGGYIQGFAFAPLVAGWQLCNGTANVKYLKSDGTTGTINLPNLVGHFPKFNTAAPNPPVVNAAGQTANITPNTGVSTSVTAQNVTGCTSANPTVVTLAAAHTCSVGDVVRVDGILKGGVGSAVNGVRAITGTGANTLTFNVNTGAEGAYTAGTGSVTDDSANLAHTHDTGNPPYTELLPYFRQ